jgi:hypothetical protein
MPVDSGDSAEESNAKKTSWLRGAPAVAVLDPEGALLLAVLLCAVLDEVLDGGDAVDGVGAAVGSGGRLAHAHSSSASAAAMTIRMFMTTFDVGRSG